MIRLLAALLVACCAFAQDSALERLKQELKVAQGQEIGDDQKARDQKDKTGAWPDEEKGRRAARIARVHSALLAWIESQLPKGPSASAIKSSDWEASMHHLLDKAGIAEKESPGATDSGAALPGFEKPGFDYVSLGATWMPELPGMLFITVGVHVRCGEDQAVYGYRFDANGWARVISDHPESDWGTFAAPVELSDADFKGSRLLLIHRLSVQCASFWMGTNYTVFHVSPDSVTQIFSSQHGFWMGNDDDGLISALKPDELIIELLDNSVDMGVHNRTQIHRYNFTDGVKRIEPVALQPQDFAEEWLTQPWSEVQSMSLRETQKWHAKLHSDLVFADYVGVTACSGKADRWLIGLEFDKIGEKELPEPLDVYFLVRELRNYRFVMEAVNDREFEQCPGEGQPSEQHPWLSREQLKALP